MRHLWSLLLSLVLTPLIYVAAGYSAVQLSAATELGLAAGLGLLGAFVAGALYALLVMTRLSPVGPVLAGLIYLSASLWALLSRSGFDSVVPADFAGQQDLLHKPVPFGTALLAVPLLVTIFSARRWRARADGTAPAAKPGATPSGTPAETTEPLYPPPILPSGPNVGTPSYEPPVFIPPSQAPPIASEVPPPPQD
jgi:hypothetical protein